MVVLGSSPAGLQVLARSRVGLIDPRDPESRQPYHAVETVCIEEATGRLQGYMAAAKSMALAGIQSACEDLQGQGYHLKSVGIIEAAARKQSSLSSILASHALIHAADGDHFRNALAATAEQHGIAVSRIPARALEEQAVARLRKPLQEVRDTVGSLRRQVGPPWGADQKQAALLAWLLLSLM